MNTNEHYVYIYLDPRKEGKFSYSNVSFLLEPFYVGKGKGIRFKKHLTIKDKSYKTHKINKIIKSGLSPEIVFIRSGLEEVQANKLEMLLISTIGRLDKNDGPLLNLTNGGEGVAGFTPSEATKKKLSKALLGRPLSNETKNKMKGRQPWNKGISLTEEQRERLSPTMFKKGQIAYNRGIPMSTEKYEKCSETFFGKGHIPWNKGLGKIKILGRQ